MGILWENKYIFMTKPEALLTVIIPAAGSGVRMGNSSKVLSELMGRTAVEYSLDVFESSPYVKQIVISTSEDIYAKMSEIAARYTKVKCVVPGGETRQKSVLNAFRAAFENQGDITPFVAIHDAARPLIERETFENAVKCAVKYGSAVCASKVRDTVRRTDKAGFATEEVDRNNLWSVQTPQIFDTDIYHTALAYAEKNKFDATDDASLLVYTGFKVRMFEYPASNIKLTYPEDIALAEAILKSRKNKGE